MTFTYHSTVDRTLDQVRLFVGDTDSVDPQLQDEEIIFLLDQDPDPLVAAIAAADSIAAKYARRIDTTLGSGTGSMQRSYMQLQESYERLADRLRRKIATRGIAPYVGGASKSERQADAENCDRVQPIFTVGMEQELGTFESPAPHPGQPFPY